MVLDLSVQSRQVLLLWAFGWLGDSDGEWEME